MVKLGVAMFHEIVGFIFMLSVGLQAATPYSYDEKRSLFLNNTFQSTMQSRFRDYASSDEILLGGQLPVKRETVQSFEQRSNFRPKRGIMLIDEDFDVPASPGVKHGWDEEGLKPTDDIFQSKREESITPEGSGSSTVEEDIRPAHIPQPLMTKLGEISQPRNGTNPTMPLEVITEIEGSGLDIPVRSTPIANNFDNANDYSEAYIKQVCLNISCNSSEVNVLPSDTEFVPEGMNLTLSCKAGNYTDYNLYWYKMNGSETSLLKRSDNEHKLIFHIFEATRNHSGMYFCIRTSRESCCYKEVKVTVYIAPDYKYQLVIISIITGVCLISCILLGIWRSCRIKKYTEQFVNTNDNEKPLLI